MKNKEIETMKVIHLGQVPECYTGIVISEEFGGEYWYKEGKIHRTDGPAIEYFNGEKRWIVNNEEFFAFQLRDLIDLALFIGKEKGKYELYWLRFMTERGIKEYPIIPGMEEYGDLGIKIKEIKEKFNV